MQFYDFKEIEERVILIGVQTEQDEDVAASLDELEELAATAGAVTVGKVIQNREAVHPGTYIGKGKIEEVAALLAAYDANGVICDDELSPEQMNNLERELDCKVMDRTLLILDIFAGRATTSEGKIQVELAQLRYRSARLVGLRESLSRLGGGIGTRGPGEKKLETDRRLIRTRISALKAELAQVEKHRELIRGKRTRGNLKTAAIVGYTNAGKSTLLNLIGGMDTPTSGSIKIDGEDISKYNENQLSEYRAENIGFIFQFYNILPTLTVLENVKLVKDIVKNGIDSKEAIKAVGLEKHMDKFPNQLSGGEQQRVSIARAIAKDPKLLLCDEPTGALDSKTGVDVLKLLRKQCDGNNGANTVIIVTHNSLFAEIADTVIRVKNGKIESVTTNKEPKKIDEVKW